MGKVNLDLVAISKFSIAFQSEDDPHGKTERLIRTLAVSPDADLDAVINMVKKYY